MAVTTITGVKVRKTHLEVAGSNYFRRDAYNTRLVCWGEKKTPIAGQNGLEVEGHMPASKFKIDRVTTLKIEIEGRDADEFSADLTPAQVEFAGASVTTARELAIAGKLKLVMLTVSPANLTKVINNTPRTLSALKDGGDDMRVVSTVFVAMKAVLAERITTTTSGGAVGTLEGIVLTLSGSHEGESETTVTIKPKTSFAYGLMKPVYNGRPKKADTEIKSWDRDLWGPGN